MKKNITVFFFLATVVGYSQQNIQISFGTFLRQESPRSEAVFSATDNIVFSRGLTSVTGAVLLLNEFTPKIGIRYGVEFRGSPLTSKMRFEKEVDGQSETINLVYDYQVLDINLPVDVSFNPKKWIYFFGGIYPTFRIDLNDSPDNVGLSFLTPEQTKRRIDE